MSESDNGIISRKDHQRYRGKFVALDGWPQKGSPARVIGSGADFAALEVSLREVGKVFEDVIILRIPPESTQCYACSP